MESEQVPKWLNELRDIYTWRVRMALAWKQTSPALTFLNPHNLIPL